jgi:hypothetical protein
MLYDPVTGVFVKMNRDIRFNSLIPILSTLRAVSKGLKVLVMGMATRLRYNRATPAVICGVVLLTGAAFLVFRGLNAVSVSVSSPDAGAEQIGAGTTDDISSTDNGKIADQQMVQQPLQDTGPEPVTVSFPEKNSAGAVEACMARFSADASPVTEYGAVKFVTLSSPDDYFEVSGMIINVSRYASVEEAPLDFNESGRWFTRVRFTRPGFYGLTVQEKGRAEQYYSVFVSPLPTVHTDAAGADFDWYRTQFNTGTTSNCGPASVAMGVAWSTGEHLPVSSVREAVGWQGEGATSFEELIKVLKDQGISAAISPIRGVQNIRDVIDTGGIAVVLFHTGGIGTARGDPAQDLFGKYYNDSVGHYIVIKGYSLDGEYFVIYDPIPSDWSFNSFRYGDDLSMIGRNRYYSSAELLRSLRRADMIAISRSH